MSLGGSDQVSSKEKRRRRRPERNKLSHRIVRGKNKIWLLSVDHLPSLNHKILNNQVQDITHLKSIIPVSIQLKNNQCTRTIITTLTITIIVLIHLNSKVCNKQLPNSSQLHLPSIIIQILEHRFLNGVSLVSTQRNSTDTISKRLRRRSVFELSERVVSTNLKINNSKNSPCLGFSASMQVAMTNHRVKTTITITTIIMRRLISVTSGATMMTWRASNRWVSLVTSGTRLHGNLLLTNSRNRTDTS